MKEAFMFWVSAIGLLSVAALSWCAMSYRASRFLVSVAPALAACALFAVICGTVVWLWAP